MNVSKGVLPETSTKARMNKLKKHAKFKKKLTIFSFLVIPVTLLMVFSYLPLANIIGYSFTDWDGLSDKRTFVGFYNYIEVFKNPEYFRVFKVCIYYFIGGIIQLVIALYFATILSFKVRFKEFFKGIIFFPNLINSVAISFMFLLFYRPGGTLDTALAVFGIESGVKWLGNPDVINWSLALTSIWKYTGLTFIMFFGAIQAIPTDIYEAAELDGVNGWQKFRYIILPNISLLFNVNLIMLVSGVISVFEMPYVMTGGANGSMTFLIKTVETAFKYSRVGMASAMAVIVTLLVIVVTGIGALYRKKTGGN